MLDQFDERGSRKRTQRSRLKQQHVFEAKAICSLDKVYMSIGAVHRRRLL